MKTKNEFLEALLKEMEQRRNYIGEERVDTIYFGGGTPSLLTLPELANVMSRLRSLFAVDADAEVTLEANPDDISRELLQGWKAEGINRLSIGVQSFFEEDLLWMNRAHTADQAAGCIRLAKEEGLGNISIDLIYGSPGTSDDKWAANLATAAALQIPHLSCYALTVEPDTALYHMTRKKTAAAVNAEDQARQFLMMSDFLQTRGYEHYEISNLALPGKRSRHNSSYWSGTRYLGLGPSAHSFNGESRQWNIANNALYMESIRKGEWRGELEILTEAQRQNEYIMTSLRTAEGLDLQLLQPQFLPAILQPAGKFLANGWLLRVENKLVLTREGKLFADGIASELFVD